MNRRWRTAAEFGPAVLFTVLSQIEIWVGPIPLMGGSTAGSRWNLATFVGLISIGLALRLRHPLLALVLTMGPMALHWPAQHFLPAQINPNLFEIFLAEVFIVYSTSAHTGGRLVQDVCSIAITWPRLGRWRRSDRSSLHPVGR